MNPVTDRAHAGQFLFYPLVVVVFDISGFEMNYCNYLDYTETENSFKNVDNSETI